MTTPSEQRQPTLWDRLRGRGNVVVAEKTRPLRYGDKPEQRDDLTALGPVIVKGDQDATRYAARDWQWYGAHAGVVLARWEERAAPTTFYVTFADRVLVVVE